VGSSDRGDFFRPVAFKHNSVMKLYPLVTAVIPTYNRENEVCRAVDSILGQTYKNIEIIVVDDGSTDGTQARLERYGDKIRFVGQTNAGPSAARNHGIRLSRGEIVAFLDSDDIWLPTKVERQVSIMQRAGDAVPCCLCNASFRFTDGRQIKSFDMAQLRPSYADGVWENVSELFLTRFVLFNQSVAVRREVLERIGGFDEALWCLEDYDLALRLSLEGPWGYTTEPLVVWLQGASGSLYKKAMEDDVGRHKVWLGIQEKYLTEIRSRNLPREWCRKVERELKRSRDRVRRAELARSDSKMLATLSAWSGACEHYRMAVYRRTPWFPKMKVRELEAPRATAMAVAP
jgi:glycosyltransferase involved in cell wall biosynthesis